MIKYPTLKKHKITNKIIAEALGYKNLKSFYQSSARDRIMNGIEEISVLLINKIKQSL